MIYPGESVSRTPLGHPATALKQGVKSQQVSERLELIALEGEGAIRAGRAQFTKCQARILFLFDKFEGIESHSLPTRFLTTPSLPKYLDNLETLTEEYLQIQPIQLNEKRRERLESRLLQELDRLDQSYTAASPEQQELPLEQRLSNQLRSLPLHNELKEAAVSALVYLVNNGLGLIANNYLKALLASDTLPHELAGTISELQTLQLIAAKGNLEILGSNINIKRQRDGIEIEFFDIVARDKNTQKLVLIEVKNNNNYSLGDFIYQFFGLGGLRIKTICQVEPLLHPENFQFPESLGLAKEIASGNFEVRVVTYSRQSDLKEMYGQGFVIRRLINHFLLPTTQISPSSKTDGDLTQAERNRELTSLRDTIRRENPLLASQVTVRFELLRWQQKQSQAMPLQSVAA